MKSVKRRPERTSKRATPDFKMCMFCSVGTASEGLGVWLPLSSFRRSKRTVDGHGTKCRECLVAMYKRITEDRHDLKMNELYKATLSTSKQRNVLYRSSRRIYICMKRSYINNLHKEALSVYT